MNCYILSQIGNADEMPVYFSVPSTYTVDDVRAQFVMIETSADEKMFKLPPHIILNWKPVHKEQLSIGIIVRYQPKGLMTNELWED